ncbi:hypothetical protein LOC68_15210 [Blastopirellula sp. JC732]|uniref:Uncharacterized protein n=1 Tax=Blastopirellula sediminis TaxID=2894196 RepID=A0A9X1MM98_9BACT|nr:hypothetical protein [Blastopirellula sediminis]MCC9606967.1 hypothetical protein [Blastopirellula sediminis]MCC9629738.1 hypothetical protein [Blastopirellula sediminis]
MNYNPDAYGYRLADGSYQLEGFSFDFHGGNATCSVVPEGLAWGEIGNQPQNVVYLTLRLSGDELDHNNNLRHLQYHAGIDLPFYCLNKLLEDIDALRSGEMEELTFPSNVKQLEARTEFAIRHDPQWGHSWMLHFSSSFPVDWKKRNVPIAWEVDQPPGPEESRHDPFALKLLVRFPIDDESLAIARDRLRHFIHWIGDKAPGC